MGNRMCHRVPDRHILEGRSAMLRVALTILIGALALLALSQKSSGREYKLLSYGEWGVIEPRFRTMAEGSGWSNESSALPAYGDARWVVLKACPNREEAILGVLGANYDLTVQVWNGVGWSGFVRMINNSACGNSRFFDIAYESQSGDAIVVYGSSRGLSPCFRKWDGKSWSDEEVVSLPGDRTRPQYWVVLEPSRHSDEIVMVCQDDFRRLYASVWDGDQWTNSIGEFDKSRTDEYLGFGVCRQGLSDDAVVIWRPEQQFHLQHMTWDGSGWGPILQSQDLPLGTDAGMVVLAGEPGSNRVIAGVGDVHGDLAVGMWSGSAWGPFERLADSFRVVGHNRSWDVTFEERGGRALLVYSDATSPVLKYRTYYQSWSEELTGPTMRSPINVLALGADRDGVALLSLGDASNIEYAHWDGSQFSPPNQLETDASFDRFEPFDLVSLADAGPRVVLISPNGGERLCVGETYLITWMAQEDLAGTHVNIHYTTAGAAGGLAWKPIVLGELNRFHYLWHVPDEPSEQCLVKVTLYDESMNNSSDASDSLFTIYTTTGTPESEGRIHAGAFELLQNEPNPVCGATSIEVRAPRGAEASLTIWDSAGRRVEWFSFRAQEGLNRLLWDGSEVPPGVYFYHLSARWAGGSFEATRQMTVLR